MELTGGQLVAGEPVGQLVGVVGKISMLSGVKAQEAKLGSPEQESVTNIGAVKAALSSGVMVTEIVPEVPAEILSGRVEGETAAKLMAKFGVELV
jgi:hypothetical protein